MCSRLSFGAGVMPLQCRIGHKCRHRVPNRGIVGVLLLVFAGQEEIDHLLTDFDLPSIVRSPSRRRFLDLRTRSRAGVVAIALACNSVTVCAFLVLALASCHSSAASDTNADTASPIEALLVCSSSYLRARRKSITCSLTSTYRPSSAAPAAGVSSICERVLVPE